MSTPSKLVPTDPTYLMIGAGARAVLAAWEKNKNLNSLDTVKIAYAAMLDAAPTTDAVEASSRDVRKERRFEIRQGGMTVAATEGPGADAYRDAVHYFWQYQPDATEDEPVEMVELTTVMRIDAIAKESGK